MKHKIAAENAEKMLEWIKSRGGLAIWNSVNLSNPGSSWTTPANKEDGTPTAKPSWELADKPERIITDASECEVITAKEVKRFHVAIRRGSEGFSFKLTDASSRKVKEAVKKAGNEAWYEFDYGSQECVILVPGTKINLVDWPLCNAVIGALE